LDVLGDKWSIIIVRDMFNGKKTFGDFLGSPEKISTSVLTSRLELLKSCQIIDSVPDLKDKKVKRYYLTDKGIDLFPVMYEMFYWSMRNFNTGLILRPNGFASHLQKDSDKKGVKGMSSDQVINEAQIKYLKIRSSILN
jgi:DNA-binding HxlR family transcriptional regulator